MTSKIIYKWGPLTGLNTISVRGRVIHAEYRDIGKFTANQGIYVWTEAKNDDVADDPYYDLEIVGTGTPYDGVYHKTVIMPNGLVWHIVEKSYK